MEFNVVAQSGHLAARSTQIFGADQQDAPRVHQINGALAHSDWTHAMRKISKIKGLIFDVAVLVAVIGGLSLACALGSALDVNTAHATAAHQVAVARITPLSS
jgi:hypothetical protein